MHPTRLDLLRRTCIKLGYKLYDRVTTHVDKVKCVVAYRETERFHAAKIGVELAAFFHVCHRKADVMESFEFHGVLLL
jgi:hypothetical protein